MLTRLTIRNFKRFGEVEIELGSPVVFIGPNNSGKTSAMQALALWDIGLKRWNEKRSGKSTPEKRPGVTVNRRDLVAIPIPDANLLWRGLHVRDVRRVDGRQTTSNIRIDLIVEGVSNDSAWTCGLELDYANEESFYCRPLRLSDGRTPERMPVPAEAGDARIAFLPPMSGLAATETRLDQGAVNVRIGEGRTAEVLRNLCFRIHEEEPDRWAALRADIQRLFGSELDAPRYVAERGEIAMTYREQGARLDLSSSGRGLQQTLLLLAYMYANPGAVLLLDEPDAHLEILRQRQTYRLLTDVVDPAPPDMAPIECLTWTRREIENYLCSRATLEAYAAASGPPNAPGPLFSAPEAERRREAMREAIDEIESALRNLRKPSPWDARTKASDDFLDPLFASYFDKLGLPNLMAKSSYHELVEHVPAGELDPEIGEKLDEIAQVAEGAA